MKKVDKIIVVGGGTSGCISALILKTAFPQKEIKIIESSNLGIVGVGESSTEHWSNFCEYIGISPLSAILEANATFKVGVYFKNWGEEDFIHSIAPPHRNVQNSYFYNYAYLISNKQSSKNLHSPSTWRNEISVNYLNNNLNNSPTQQYHFDTFALNKFLHKQCLERGIEIIQDDLVDAHLFEENGDISYLKSNSKKYYADFFIDCSGFQRFLLQKTYNISWNSYSKYLPTNSAIAFATEEMEEYNKYTLATARNSGWSWQIPVQGRTGNGYVYCDSFISKDQAHQEMEQGYGKRLEIAKEFKFDPGRLENAWHKNCYAVGLSQSFVEPLEATSIGSVIQQMFCFVHFLPSYDYKSCNKIVNDIFENIVDYVQSHYLTQREDTDFWKNLKYNLNLTPNLTSYLEMWKNRLPLEFDIKFCPWQMFHTVNYIPILYGLGVFDTEKVKEEYLNYNIEHVSKEELENLTNYENNLFWIGHKNFINLIKSK